MKGRLQIDFELSAQGRQVNVSGLLHTPQGTIAVTQDVMFCLGLLDYAKQLLWAKESVQLEQTGTAAIVMPPPGIDAKALRTGD